MSGSASTALRTAGAKVSGADVTMAQALVRCPSGVEQGCFFQKRAWAGISEHIVRAKDPEDGEELLAVRDVKGLLALTQASVLEIHVWGAKLDTIAKPDGITFDLDPAPEVGGPSWSKLPSRCATG